MGDNNSLSLGGYSSPCLILKNEVAGSLPPSTLRWLRHRERAYPPHSFQNNIRVCGISKPSQPSTPLQPSSDGDISSIVDHKFQNSIGAFGTSSPSQPSSGGGSVGNSGVSNVWFHPVRRRTGAGANKERMLQQIKNRLYQQLHPTGYSDVALEHGYSAIFNLEFSPSG